MSVINITRRYYYYEYIQVERDRNMLLLKRRKNLEFLQLKMIRCFIQPIFFMDLLALKDIFFFSGKITKQKKAKKLDLNLDFFQMVVS